MNKIGLFVALVAVAGPSAGSEVSTVLLAKNDRLFTQFRTSFEPRTDVGPMRIGGGVSVSGDGVFHRYMIDRAQKIYVGYDVRLQELEDKTQILLTIEPFSLDPSKLPIEQPSSWSAIPLVREPRAQALKLMETVALDLLVNPVTGQKVIDYITVGRDLNQLNDRPRKGLAPRLFTAEEVEMELNSPTVLVNGERLSKDGAMRVTGETIGLYMKDRGRFVMSLLPNERLGFRRAGSVSGSRLEFEWAGDRFEVESSRRIAPGAGAFHLYVFHEPGFQDRDQTFYVFGAGRPETLLK